MCSPGDDERYWDLVLFLGRISAKMSTAASFNLALRETKVRWLRMELQSAGSSPVSIR